MQAINSRALLTLKAYRGRLSPQEYKTLRGQVLSGNDEGAIKGLEKILRRKENETRKKSDSKTNEIYAGISPKPRKLACKQ